MRGINCTDQVKVTQETGDSNGCSRRRSGRTARSTLRHVVTMAESINEVAERSRRACASAPAAAEGGTAVQDQIRMNDIRS
jgi:hypothetical protein